MRSSHKIDKILLISLIVVVVLGLFIFSSASMGLLARAGAKASSITLNHIGFGFGGGLIAMIIMSKINYKVWRKYSFVIFVLAMIATALVFVPGIGFKSGGAYRWLNIAGFSFQPSEFLKIAYVIFLASWLSYARDKVVTFTRSILPFVIITFITAVVMLAQPDTDTFMVMFFAGLAMLIASGVNIKYILGLGMIAVVLIAGLAIQRPYLMSRLKTFIDPASDPKGAGYQIQQSLIAIGSGQAFGRGFGQSVQKFNFLPEPVGDSIFAVAGEEFGFVGCALIILMFTFFYFRGLLVAYRAQDAFGGLVAVGIVIMIASQSFINIGAMVGILPLSGIPLVFVSQGGTALLFALASVGILLNISRYRKS